MSYKLARCMTTSSHGDSANVPGGLVQTSTDLAPPGFLSYRVCSWLVLWASFLVFANHSEAVANQDPTEQFEKEVRPLLVEHCLECHHQDSDSGGLILNSREALLKGGETGPALVVGNAEASRIIQAVRRTGELKMPPDAPLDANQIQSLVRWINSGAIWPEKSPPLSQAAIASHAKSHWAFQDIRQPVVPQLDDAEWARNPIDLFILRQQRKNQLQPAPEAPRRTLLRRLSYSLTGLPPTDEDVRNFESNPDTQAYENQVDVLLSSQHYGEHWARHWLDVARYSDTKGYVYAREERFWPHAWAYRDWVARALNEDMPYNRFLLLQLAADQVQDCRLEDHAAMGFLTLGRRFLGVEHLIIDDRIDVVTRGTMGLTVGCARCHDHKYDPIPTADYYSLYGVFESSAEALVRLPDLTATDKAFEEELEKRQVALREKLASSRAEASARARDRVRDYLLAQTELDKYPPKGFDQIFQKDDLLPAFVWAWKRYLDSAATNRDPIFLPWIEFQKLPVETFEQQASELIQKWNTSPTEAVNVSILQQFATPPVSFAEVIQRYADVFEGVIKRASAEDFAGRFEDAHQEEIRVLLFEDQSPSIVPDEPIVHSEEYFDSGTLTAIWKLQGEVDRWIVNSQQAVPFALTLNDRRSLHEPRVFIRGNPIQAGRSVPRQFLQVLAGPDRQPFSNGSGRLELAQAIISPKNPLTARVIVNRVWTHHFGQGLVSTPSDFGTRAETPSHSELLDWLASWFIEEGWSLKALHRLIVTSATYRQASAISDADRSTQALQIDPENRLLWRMNPHRLTFEEFRDSLMMSAGSLDLTEGGKPVKLFQRPFPKRRTLYGLVDRQYLPGTLRVFDFANPDLHIAKRNETTVPQQALFYLNHPLVLEQVRLLAKNTAGAASPEDRVLQLFQHVLQRPPHENELTEALQFIETSEEIKPQAVPPTATDWSYGYGKYEEGPARVAHFTKLPHFTGSAWQGGPNWPDTKLGWVQLTSTGGHPGNTREFASIRRWTAPQTGKIKIESKLIHEPAPGDGIRAWIVSSRQGLLSSAELHQGSTSLSAAALPIEAGETIDFIVDIKDVLNSDQYLWSVTIHDLNAGQVWNSVTDFPQDEGNRFTSWEQLAHILICTNEFQFVD